MRPLSRRLVLAQALLATGALAGCSPASPLRKARSIARVARSDARAIRSFFEAHLNAPPAAPVSGPPSIVIDASQRLRPISPLIYGLAGGDSALSRQIRPTLQRWGGNPASRHNWRLGNATNAGRDWEFRNVNYGHTSDEDRQPSGVADQSIAANKAIGAATVLTVPAIGWVARDDNTETRSLNVPGDGGPPLHGVDGPIAGYDPASNRTRTSVPSFARRPAGDVPPDAVFQDDWVRHLVQRFGDAAHGGVPYYAIDNEPELWSFTHTDVHPGRMGYDDMVQRFQAHATAIKDVDPTAQVTGPVLSGWLGLFYSALDQGSNKYHTHADRSAHGGAPFLPWWLEQVRANDERMGRRSLDVVDVHWYGSGFGEGNDPSTNTRRLRSTRSLWDPTYVDESWIANTYDEKGVRGVVRLLPRLREWIAGSYPGTKIGITEWNWGADDTPNGALAIADALGIFGREGVHLAAYWQAPKQGSPGALAFQAYRNFDGQGGSFGDTALAVTVSDPDLLSCFASLDGAGNLIAVVLNKHDSATVDVPLRLGGYPSEAAVAAYQYTASGGVALRPLPPLQLTADSLHLTLPPTSITVLRLARA